MPAAVCGSGNNGKGGKGGGVLRVVNKGTGARGVSETLGAGAVLAFGISPARGWSCGIYCGAAWGLHVEGCCIGVRCGKVS